MYYRSVEMYREFKINKCTSWNWASETVNIALIYSLARGIYNVRMSHDYKECYSEGQKKKMYKYAVIWKYDSMNLGI